MNTEPTKALPPSIATALVKAQKASHAVEKGQTMNGQKFSYKFAGAEAVIEEARRALAEADLGVFVADWQSLGANGHTRIAARFCIIHAEGESWMSEPVSFPAIANAGRPPDKAEASALTYVTNYYLTRLLNLPRIDAEDVSARDDSDYKPAALAKPHPAAVQREEDAGDDHLMRFGKLKGESFRACLQSRSKRTRESAEWYRNAISQSVDNPEKAQFRDSNMKLLAKLNSIVAEVNGGPPHDSAPPPSDDDAPWHDDAIDQDEIPF